MDVHPTKNVSIGIDPYPYIKIYKIPHWIWPSSFPSVPLSGEPKPPLRLRPAPSGPGVPPAEVTSPGGAVVQEAKPRFSNSLAAPDVGLLGMGKKL